MGQFAYRATDATGEFYAGPLIAPDAESVVLKARERGHRVIQVFFQSCEDASFEGILSYPAVPLPPDYECSKWRLFERRPVEARIQGDRYRHLLSLVSSGELTGVRQRFPPRLVIDTDSMVARACNHLQAQFAHALEAGFVSAGKDRRATAQIEPDGKSNGNAVGAEEDNLVEELRAILGGIAPAEAAGLCVVEMNQPVVAVKTREGSTLSIPRPETSGELTLRALDVAYAGSCAGFNEPAPAAILAKLIIEEAARRGASGIRATDALVPGSQGFRLEMLLNAEFVPLEPSPPKMIFGLVRDYLAAMSGISPLDVPPAECERSALIAGERFVIRSRISLTSDGEAILIEWRRA